jgi:hypothetical protein
MADLEGCAERMTRQNMPSKRAMLHAKTAPMMLAANDCLKSWGQSKVRKI